MLLVRVHCGLRFILLRGYKISQRLALPLGAPAFSFGGWQKAEWSEIPRGGFCLNWENAVEAERFGLKIYFLGVIRHVVALKTVNAKRITSTAVFVRVKACMVEASKIAAGKGPSRMK